MDHTAEMPESEGPARVGQVAAYVRVLGIVGLDGYNIGAMLERRLLACLAANYQQPMRTDRLIDALWEGHPPRAAENSLMSKVTRLRARLGADVLVRTANGYQLKLTAANYDAAHFDDLAQTALNSSGQLALLAAKGAMALWRGEPFSEFSADDFASAETARLTRLYDQTAERYAELLLELGDVAQALAQAEWLLHTVPSSERLCAIQARALSLEA